MRWYTKEKKGEEIGRLNGLKNVKLRLCFLINISCYNMGTNLFFIAIRRLIIHNEMQLENVIDSNTYPLPLHQEVLKGAPITHSPTHFTYLFIQDVLTGSLFACPLVIVHGEGLLQW